MLRDEGGEFAVGTDVPPIQRTARRPGEMHRQAEQVIDVAIPGHLGEVPQLVYHPDNPAIRGRLHMNVGHLDDLSVDQYLRHMMRGQHIGDRSREPAQQMSEQAPSESTPAAAWIG